MIVRGYWPTVPYFAVVVVSCMLGRVSAAVESFSERTAFEAAAGMLEVEDLDSLAGTNLCNPFSDSGPFCGPGPIELPAGDLTISGRAQPYVAPGALLLAPELRFGVSGGGSLVTGALPATSSNFFFTLEISANGPLTAFGADTRFWAKDIVVTLLDGQGSPIGETTTLSPPETEFGFFGVIADAPFETIRIRSGNDDFVNYDNLAYRVVPESSSAVLGLLGAATLVLRCRRLNLNQRVRL